MEKWEYEKQQELMKRNATFQQVTSNHLEAIERKLDKLNESASSIERWTAYCATAAIVFLAIQAWHWYMS
ncbi:hypothetical protein [Hydrogenophaga defluvii]|uniref:Hemolysin XhlA n=1 Tax=Hydrogenophaga defluvii TaxID=249410 RepID=A0ABW2SAX5_9BURK